jgi:preprotein translocase subunit SecD
MGRIACLVLALAGWPILVSSCGSGATPEPKTYVILEADTSSLSAAVDVDDAMENVEKIIEQRAEAFGARVLEIQRQGTNRLALQLSGITPEEARDLIGRTAELEFKEPERVDQADPASPFVCTSDATGESFTVPSDVVGTGDQARPSNLVPAAQGHNWRCVPTGGTVSTGNLNWVPATAIGTDGLEKALTGHFLKANARVELMGAGGQLIFSIEFNSEGGKLFGEITDRLVGLPMAIFLDQDIISAPTIRAHITGGKAVIEGLSLEEGRTLAIQLNSGALPVPVWVIAAGEGPLP